MAIRTPKKRPPTHPGEMLLKEFLEPMGMSQVELAKHLGWAWPRIDEIVNGRRAASADSALAFGEVFGTGPGFWLNLPPAGLGPLARNEKTQACNGTEESELRQQARLFFLVPVDGSSRALLHEGTGPLVGSP